MQFVYESKIEQYFVGNVLASIYREHLKQIVISGANKDDMDGSFDREFVIWRILEVERLNNRKYCCVFDQYKLANASNWLLR